MTRFVLAFLLLSLGSIIGVSGCGTTHHFLPPRPLEKGEAMVSIAWHYDLGQLHAVDFFPDGNFYFGAGKDCNIGFGSKILSLSVNHITAAKYWSNDNSDYTSAFVHVNQLLGPNNNPYLEVGGAYFKWKDSFNQSFVLGLGLGTGVVTPPYSLWSNPGNHRTFKRRLKLMPFAKYVAAGSDFGVSVSYYHGINRAGMDRLIETFYQKNDTVLVVARTQIDSVSYPDEPDSIFTVRARLYLSTGDTVELRELDWPCGDVLFRELPPAMFAWFDAELYLGRIGRFGTDEAEYELTANGRNYSQVYVDLRELRERIDQYEDIVFWRYPEEINRKLLRRRQTLRVWNDLSFGMAALAYDKSDD